MTNVTRREFLRLGSHMAAMMGLGASAVPRVAAALEDLSTGRARVLWLQGLSCSGCSVSFLNSMSPGPAEVLTGSISLLFHATLSTATGEVALGIMHRAIEEGNYLLVAEGSVPAGMPQACTVGEEDACALLLRAARQASAVVAAGACAAFGGIPAAQGNPTGAVSVPDFLRDAGVDKPLIRLPGCPIHPDWLVGTLAHVTAYGLPELDDLGRPAMFYGHILHDQCPRFADYERENFAQSFADRGCLFRLGCLGPHTNADCTLRQWNGGVNSCIRAGAPCTGCASPSFALDPAFPFLPELRPESHVEDES